MSSAPLPSNDRPTLRDLWEILSLPALLGLAAIAATWLVWYLTSASCSFELAQTTGCNPARIAQYVNLEVMNKIVTHAAIAAGGGGIWSYAMITRERKAREAAERRLAEVLAQAAEERAQAAEERAQTAEERRQLLALIERLTEQLNGGNLPGSQ